MLKLLLAQTTRSASGSAARYFLSLADEIGGDATVFKSTQKENSLPGFLSAFRFSWMPEVFFFNARYGRNYMRETVETSRLFSYDLIIAAQRNERELFWNSPPSYLARSAWAPVMLIPKETSFAPFHNILFTDDQLFYTEQTIIRKLNSLWPHQRFLYPLKRKQHRIGSYHARRFDETGYNAVPELDINRLSQYVKRHRVGLIVTSYRKNRIDNRALSRLPVPTLYFNSRNTSPGAQLHHLPAALSTSLSPL